MPNKCVLCHTGFKTWQEYNDHMRKHSQAASPIAPLKSSNESTEKIVDRVERGRLRPYLLGHGVDRLPPPLPEAKIEVRDCKVEIVRGFDRFAQEVSN